MKVLCKFAAILLCVLIIGCSSVIKSGNIISKRFSPAHDENQLVQYGEIWVNETTHVPDRWFVTIGLKCEDNKYRTREIKVTKKVHDYWNIGDWANFD